jgi:NTP pyrophosphatase (non-canonical NTP hydrolase)
MIWTQQQISQWADKTFGTAYNAAIIGARANMEMAELAMNLAVTPAGSEATLEEIADVVILLKRLAAMCGGDLDAAVDRKMDINVKRDWATRGDGVGDHK